MSNIVPISSNVPAALRRFDTLDNDVLSNGLTGGFGVLSIKGGKFAIKHGKESEPVVDEDGVPRASLEVILVSASPHVAKTFYKGDYTGQADEPDCYSLDGEKPAQRAPLKQAELCAICPQNKFGSKVGRNGGDAKACTDSRRVAVVPAYDIGNEQFGGPMLLRCPTMSLGDLGSYGKLMKAKGFPYFTVVTRISFDPESEYPKLMFKAVRPVTEDEASDILEHLNSDKVESILFEGREVTAHTAATTPMEDEKPKAVDTDFEVSEAPKAPKKKKKKAPVKEVKVEAEPEPEPEPVPAPVEAAAPSESDPLKDDLDALFDDWEDD